MLETYGIVGAFNATFATSASNAFSDRIQHARVERVSVLDAAADDPRVGQPCLERRHRLNRPRDDAQTRTVDECNRERGP